MQKLRKAFTISVMVMTVLSMSVVVAPQASASASAGDLIKMDGLSSVYYLASDGKRYVFPNEATYFSWYSDFSGIVTIPQSELESYPLGKNVSVRPGTKLVKITTNPKVYAVTPNGVLKAIPDEATALALYGENWAQRIVDIADAFFTNYTISPTELSATAYPEGSLVKFGEGADVYYIDASGNARKIADEAAFLANRFRWDDVITSSLPLPTTGADITGAEADLIDTASGAGGTAGAGTGLTVAIASDTPAAGNIPAGSPVDFLKLNFTAAADGAVSINAITLSAYDLGVATYIDSVTFYQNGMKVGTSKNMTSDRIATFNFSTPINVAAGTTESLTARATIESGKSGNFAIGLASASNVVTNGAVVSGSFPIVGNTKAIVSGTNIGTVTMSGAGTTDTSNEFGEDDVLLASFDLAVANEPVLWESARFKNAGTNKEGIISNIKLLIDGDVVVEGASLVDKYVAFNLNNFLIAKGDSVSVEIYGDLGVSNNNDTVNLYVKEDNDFSFVGQDYGFGIEPTLDTNLDSAGDGITVTLTTGDFSIDMDKATTPAKDVRAGDNDVVLATITMVSNGENATIESISDSAGDDFEISGTGLICNEFENAELRDVDSGVIYDLSVATGSIGCALSMTDEISMVKGVVKTFEVRVDLSGSTDTNEIDENDTLQVTLEGAAMTITGDESDASITNITPSSVTSAIATVKAASLDWTTTSLTSESVTPGAEDVVVYKASLEAGDSSYVDITSVQFNVIADDGDLNGSFIDNNISKLDLYLNGTLLKSKSNAIVEAATPGAYISYTSLPSGDRRVAAGETVDLELKATFAGSFSTTSTWSLGINHASSRIVAKDMDNNNVAEDVAVLTGSRNITLADKGTLKVELKTDDTKANDDTFILAGAETTQDKYLGELVFTTANEDVLVQTLVLNQDGDANNGDIKAVKLYDEDGVEVASKAPDANGDVNFSSLDITMTADQATSLFIGVETKTINADGDDEGTASSSATIKFNIAENGTVTGMTANEAITAQGVSTSEDITLVPSVDTTIVAGEYATSTQSNLSTLGGSVLTSIVNAMDDGTLVGGTNKTIAKYTFEFDNGTNRTTANEELKAQLVELKLTVATSSASLSNIEAYIEGNSSDKLTSTTTSAGVITLDLDEATTGLAEDGLVDGTVTLVVTATITVDGSASNGSVSTEINNLNGDFTYNNNNGTGTADITNALLDYSDVTGATLSL